MRTYRCTSQACDEAFALERSRDVRLPNAVICPFCGEEADTQGYNPAGEAVERRIGYQYTGKDPRQRFVRRRPNRELTPP
jgi:hypothetical protein